MRQPVYLDHQSTTPVDPRVLEKMKPLFTEEFGNPGSRIHEYGHRAERAVEEARAVLADSVGAETPSEIVFTSGATESNNLALQGIGDQLRALGKTHLITSRIEHKSVIDVMGHLEDEGFSVTYVAPGSDGMITAREIEEAVRPETGLVSIMHAQNEIGVVYPLEAIGEVARRHGLFFHSDAAQSFGKIPVDVRKMNLHLVSMSAHKIYGPKGIGALYVRKENPAVELKPLVFGGKQERGLRSGTLPVPLIVGFGEAIRIAIREGEDDNRRISKLRDRLLRGLKAEVSGLEINGTMEFRLPHNLNVSFPGLDAESLIMSLRRDVAVSSVASCSSALWTPSYVLKAMGLGPERARSAVRFGLGRFTTEEEIDFAIARISAAVDRLRKLAV